MALVKSGTTGVGSPLLQYELYAEQTAGSVNNRTIKITLKAKPNGNGYYGYPANWRANVNGSWSSWRTLKGAETWRGSDGFKTFTYSVTVNVGTTSSKSITVGFEVDSYNGDNDWDSTVTGSFTVGATNRAPGAPSSIVVRSGGTSSGAILNSGIVPENIGAIYVSWNAATDPDKDSLKYALNHSLNSGGYVQADLGSDLAHSYSVSGWGEGSSVKFYVDAQDSKGAWGPKTYSGVYTKNKMTAGGFSGHSNDISFSTQFFDLMFGGGSNTDKTAVTYSCYSDTITIYNQVYTSGSSQRIVIWREGQSIPSSNQPYIKFSDIVETYKGSNYTGRLQVGLRTKNNYGTIKTASGSIGVDIQVTPQPSSQVSIVGGTAKKTIAGLEVFLPGDSRTIDFSWTPSSNELGAEFTYNLYQIINGSVEVKITSVDSSISSFSLETSEQLNETATLAFKVETVTSYGDKSSAVSSPIVLEYYNPPSLSVGEILRADTTASFPVSIAVNTSISSVVGKCSWSSSNQQSGTVTTEGEVLLSNLQSQSSYSVLLSYFDNSGLATTSQENISIGRNLPIVDINEKGLGVGGAVANQEYSLNVLGASNATEVFEDGKRLYSPSNKPTPGDIGAIAAVSSSTGYYGFEGPGGKDGWLRTPRVGLIPYENGTSRLGTTSWKFEDVCTNKINGMTVGAITGDRKNTVPVVGADGVMEIGKYIDFHNKTGGTEDYTVRLENNATGSLLLNGRRLYENSWVGNVPETATRISNLNSRLACGWYSFSSGTSGAPVPYGVMLQMKWDSTTDFYQLVLSSDRGRFYTRCYVNNRYSAWTER